MGTKIKKSISKFLIFFCLCVLPLNPLHLQSPDRFNMEINEPEPCINLAAACTDHLLLPELAAKGLSMDVLRLDKIHPVISGNKWFKLKYHLELARQGNHATIITFGGAYSNHLVATACACRMQGFQPVGIVRGEKPVHLSATLQTAARYGMELHYVSRQAYAQKQQDEHIQKLIAGYHHPYTIPEGGMGEAGIRGCSEILQLASNNNYSHILCCIGTGTLFKGLMLAKAAGQQLIGIPVLKLEAGSPFLQSMEQHIAEHGLATSCQLLLPYHFGGYAKRPPELLHFMNQFYQQTGIPTDFVYTGKLMAACMQLIRTGFFSAGSRLLAIHSGGLQGNASLALQTLLF